MAGKVRLDALEAQKLDAHGEHTAHRTAKEQASDLVNEARKALPGGVPDASPYKRFTHDQALSEAARLDMRHGPLMDPGDLMLVIEMIRQRLTDSGAPPAETQPPVPTQRIIPVKIRGLKPSPTNTWRVKCPTDKPKQVSLAGHITYLGNGATIEARHYTPQVLQSIVDQGVDLVPIEEPEPEE